MSRDAGGSVGGARQPLFYSTYGLRARVDCGNTSKGISLARSQSGGKAMVRMTGKRALMEVLRAEEVRYIFGNPGTSEAPIMDALEEYPDIEYMLATQEGVAMGMADGYAIATGRPSFVNLHIETGLANGISLPAPRLGGEHAHGPDLGQQGRAQAGRGAHRADGDGTPVHQVERRGDPPRAGAGGDAPRLQRGQDPSGGACVRGVLGQRPGRRGRHGRAAPDQGLLPHGRRPGGRGCRRPGPCRGVAARHGRRRPAGPVPGGRRGGASGGVAGCPRVRILIRRDELPHGSPPVHGQGQHGAAPGEGDPLPGRRGAGRWGQRLLRVLLRLRPGSGKGHAADTPGLGLRRGGQERAHGDWDNRRPQGGPGAALRRRGGGAVGLGQGGGPGTGVVHRVGEGAGPGQLGSGPAGPVGRTAHDRRADDDGVGEGDAPGRRHLRRLHHLPGRHPRRHGVQRARQHPQRAGRGP